MKCCYIHTKGICFIFRVNNIRRPDRSPTISYTQYVEVSVYGHLIQLGLFHPFDQFDQFDQFDLFDLSGFEELMVFVCS